MQFRKSIAALGLIAGSLFSASAAHADIMTATWTGTVFSSPGNAYNGDTVTESFTFDTTALGSDNFSGTYNQWYNYGGLSYGETGFYSDVSYSVGSLSGSFSLNTSPYPPDETYLGSGSNGLTYYENYAYNLNTGYGADGYAFNFTPATNGDPTQTFNSGVGYGDMYLYLPSGTLTASTNHVTVVDDSQSSVPAPGALALLGLGLIGIGGMRRKGSQP